MAKLLKLRRGTTTQHASFTGAEGEVTIDTTKDTAVIHDGSTQGGRPLAREDMNNVSSATVAGRLGTGSLATTKLAAGALPTNVTVATANLGTTGVSAGTYGSATAIPAITVNNKGQITSATTNTVNTTTNLGTSTATTSVTVTSSTGNNATIGEATGSAAGVMSTTMHNKLDGIESGATGDQTNAEIRAAVEAASDSNVFTDADHSKLNGIAASATNVTNNNQISNGAGYVTSSVINSLNASNLSSGTIPDARFPSTLPAVSAANLTNIPSSVAIAGGWQVKTGSGSITVPSGMTRIWLFAQAGGGGGGGDFYGATCNAHAGSGGNGGSVYRDYAVSGGQTVAWSLGGGGHGGGGACHVGYNGHGRGAGSGGGSTITINGSQRVTLGGGGNGGHAANWYGCHNGCAGSTGSTSGTHANDSRTTSQSDSATLNDIILKQVMSDNGVSSTNGGQQHSGSCQAPGPGGSAGRFVYGFSG